jgi:hypothetical protein
MNSGDVEAVMGALAAPFDLREVKFKPAVVSGTRAMAMAYIDARVIQDRLDDVLGGAGWQDEYECLPEGSVVCRLKLRLGGEWITKMDVGSPSEQPDEGDRRKAAFSDALKRAAVKFGIGRYLYRIPAQWVDYDPQKRQFKEQPTLPANARPAPQKASGKPAKPAPGPGGGQQGNGQKPAGAPEPKPPAKPEPKPAAKADCNGKKSLLPRDGAELQRRLYNYDAVLSKQGLCQPGELVKAVVQGGVKAALSPDLLTWNEAGIKLAVQLARDFEAGRRAQTKGGRDDEAEGVKADLDRWEGMLAGVDKLEHLNALLPELAKLGEPSKSAVWAVISTRTSEWGLKWDPVAGRFVAPAVA